LSTIGVKRKKGNGRWMRMALGRRGGVGQRTADGGVLEERGHRIEEMESSILGL
jgi:hypothetical protein